MHIEMVVLPACHTRARARAHTHTHTHTHTRTHTHTQPEAPKCDDPSRPFLSSTCTNPGCPRTGAGEVYMHEYCIVFFVSYVLYALYRLYICYVVHVVYGVNGKHFYMLLHICNVLLTFCIS